MHDGFNFGELDVFDPAIVRPPWHLHRRLTPKLIERLQKLETRSIKGATEVPPGLIPVLMWNIATRLGGYPQAQDLALDPPRRGDAVGDGFARGLGYRDYEEMNEAASLDPAAWAARVDEGLTAVLLSEGIDRTDASETAIFSGLCRVLDDAAAAKTSQDPASGWCDVGERLDDWMRSCVLPSAVIRQEARA
ncbi:hypothetical protein [Methylobacterium sp. J-090]|uniref:hypothetical protein n=1 Tax=Methylobacterium sp. J-090 TaxID=2836666 RepID=UPI001FB878C5|nr:hypothetical protein [Methylobacterium sp. J-090]MCJ2079846.1 hypothetical protein [Methylobacterium sp. J-090]